MRYRSLQLCSSQDLAGKEINQKLSLLTVCRPPRDSHQYHRRNDSSDSQQAYEKWMNEMMFSQVNMSEAMFRVTHPGFSQKLSHSSNNQNTEKKNRHFISSLCVRSQTAAEAENLSAMTSFQEEPQFTVFLFRRLPRPWKL